MAALIVLGILAAVGAVAYQKLGPRIYKQPVTVTEIALISPAQSSVLVTSTGYVVPQSWSKVGAKIPGRLARVMIKEGDQVKAGDVIAAAGGRRPEERDRRRRSRERPLARAGAETARANLAELNVRLERAQALVKQQAMPRMELQDLEARQKVLSESVRAAEAQGAAADAEVEHLKVGMKDRVILAPINGTVIAKPAMAGETVGPQLTGVANIAEIADFTSIVVEIDVPEARLGLVAWAARRDRAGCLPHPPLPRHRRRHRQAGQPRQGDRGRQGQVQGHPGRRAAGHVGPGQLPARGAQAKKR